MRSEFMWVEVVYALPAEQFVQRVRISRGATVRDAIERSGVLERRPEIALDVHRVGVFGRLCALDDTLEAGDRVEIYRSLLADPKEARRRRAEKMRRQT
ncbi:MAG: RnfH family protein [Chromatiales bacterium]